MRSAEEWNSLPADVFPEKYDLDLFKARVNLRHFLDEDNGRGGAQTTTRENVMPSLVALQQTKNRLHLAHLGKKLMKWTELAAGRELRNLSAQLDQVYKSYKEDMRNAYILLARCRYFSPEVAQVTLENISRHAYVSVASSSRYISGVKAISYEIIEDQQNKPYVHLGLGKGGEAIQECKEAWLKLLKDTILIVELRKAFVDVENAYKSATKRQNVLSRIIIPRLNNTSKYIIIELEDLAREEVHRIKMVKRIKKPIRAPMKKEEPIPEEPVCAPTCSTKICSSEKSPSPKQPLTPVSESCEMCKKTDSKAELKPKPEIMSKPEIKPKPELTPPKPKPKLELKPDPCSLCKLMEHMQTFLNCIASTLQTLEGNDATDCKERYGTLTGTLENLKTQLKSAIEESSDKSFVDACLGVACKVDDNLQILLGTPSEVKLLQEQLYKFILQAQSSNEHSCGSSSIEALIKKTLNKQLPDKDFSIVVLSVNPSLEKIDETSESCSYQTQNQCSLCGTKSSSNLLEKKKQTSQSESNRKEINKAPKSKSASHLDKCPYCDMTLVKSETVIKERVQKATSSIGSSVGPCSCGASSKASSRRKSESKTSTRVSDNSTCSCLATSKVSVKTASNASSNRLVQVKHPSLSESKVSMKGKASRKSNAYSKTNSKGRDQGKGLLPYSDTDVDKCPVCYGTDTDDDDRCPICYRTETDDDDSKCPICNSGSKSSTENTCQKSKSETSSEPCTSSKNGRKKCNKCSKEATHLYLSLVNETSPNLCKNYSQHVDDTNSGSEYCPECTSDSKNDVLLNYASCKHVINQGIENSMKIEKELLITATDQDDYDENRKEHVNDVIANNCPICTKLMEVKNRIDKQNKCQSRSFSDRKEQLPDMTIGCLKCNQENELYKEAKCQETSKNALSNQKKKTKLCGCAVSRQCNSFKILSNENKNKLSLEDNKTIDEVITTSRCGCVQIDDKESHLICVIKKPSEKSIKEKVSFKNIPNPLQSAESIECCCCNNRKSKKLQQRKLNNQESFCLECEFKQSNETKLYKQKSQKSMQIVATSETSIKHGKEIIRQPERSFSKHLTCPICYAESHEDKSLRNVKSCSNNNTENCVRCQIQEPSIRRARSFDSVVSQKDESVFVCPSKFSNERNSPIKKKSSTKEIAVCTTNIDKPIAKSSSPHTRVGCFKKNIHTYKELVRNRSASGKFNEAIKTKTVEEQSYDPYARFFEISDDEISDFNDDFNDF